MPKKSYQFFKTFKHFDKEREKTLIQQSMREEKIRKVGLCFITGCFIKPFNDTYMEKLCFTQFIQYKNLLKQKLGCFWPFSCLHSQLSSIHSIVTYWKAQMFEKGDSSKRSNRCKILRQKFFSKFFCKIWVGFLS